MALNYQQPRDPGIETRNRWANSLDSIFEQYQLAKQNARLDRGEAVAAEQRALAEKDRVAGSLLKYGFDERLLTPQIIAQANMAAPGTPTNPNVPEGAFGQGSPALPAELDHPLSPIVRDYLSKRKNSEELKIKEQNVGIEKTRSEIAENEAQAEAMRNGQIYVDPATGRQIVVPHGAKLLPKSQAEANKEGKILPANSVLSLNEGKAVARILPEVENAIVKNVAIFGPVEGFARSVNPYDTNAQTVDARMRTASQAFGRFMEGGVLRKEDEEKYRKMFPQLRDVPQVAKNKLAIVRRQLAQKYEDDRKALGGSGYDIAGFGTLDIPKSLFEDSAGGNGRGGLTPSEQAELDALSKRFGGK